MRDAVATLARTGLPEAIGVETPKSLLYDPHMRFQAKSRCMIKLQTIVFPSTAIAAPEEMYFRNLGSAVSSLAGGSIDIQNRGAISFDTFFNGLSVRHWQSKCAIADLNFALAGRGKVRVRIGLHVLNHAHRWLLEQDVELSDTPTPIALPMWPTLTDGILYAHVLALSDALVTAGHFFTETPAAQDVKLGVVITHFNRKHYVLPAMERISREIVADPDLAGRVSLVVVDNSQNIAPEEAGAAIVIPNKNLGGSGGFMRGLLHLIDNGFSHCLFMDDDASCEMEAIRRTFRIMQFSKTENLAIAGSMMREAEPSQMHEKGAIFHDGIGRPLKIGLDMRDKNHLLLAEAEHDIVGYGAWWHFGFKIADIRHFAFPFFVKADDMLFSMTNPFDILTMNGVGGWGEDFTSKEGPFTRYLGFRGATVTTLMTSDINKTKYVKRYYRMARDCLYSYNYASARAVTRAVEDVLRGPAFWRENLDLVAVREKLGREISGEKLEPIGDELKNVVHRAKKDNWFRALSRAVTLNGFLLPTFQTKNKTVYQTKFFTADFNNTFLYRRILNVLPNENVGYIAQFDRKRFWQEAFLIAKTAYRLFRELPAIRAAYRQEIDQLTSECFWRDVYEPAPERQPKTENEPASASC